MRVRCQSPSETVLSIPHLSRANLTSVKLSIIDQSPVSAGSTPSDALRNTIELARLADRLGYERYWIAEHHAIDAVASPAPYILITRLATETPGIRGGSGAVMLPHESSTQVRETCPALPPIYPLHTSLA